MDFLKSAVASAIAKGPLAPYSVGERITLEESPWILNSATRREDGTRCTIFTFELVGQRRQLPIAKNAFRKSRTLRHPGLVKVLDTIETDTALYIITEPITPLAWYTRRKSLTEETIKWGLWSIAKTVKFINEDAASVHACLRLSSVFSSESGEWKLGGFELLSSTQEDDAVVHTYSGLVPGSNRCLPPEVSKAGWGTYKTNSWTAVDAWGYANLISDVFDGPPTGPSQPTDLKDFPRSMQLAYKRLLSQNPKSRPSVANFLEQGEKHGGFFQTPLIHVASSLENLGLKTDEEREEFLNDLHETTEEFPDEFLKHKVLPELLKSVEFGGGGPKVLSVVLKIGSKLSEEEFSTQLTPVIIRLFSSPDRALRVCLLDNLPLMIDHLSQKIINDKIFPNVVTGFADVVPVVREQTVKAVLVLIGKLSDRVINGELLKHLAKTANDTEPGIRTNTTICLGKIARNLGPHTRTKVLVAAFTRSLRDPFLHARNAALMALNATADLFSEDDCANKILPAICPALLDKEKLVRDQANKALDQFLARVRKHALTLPETTSAPTTSVTAPNGTPRVATPSNAGGASDTGWAGWAISSFTNKLAAADGNIQPNARLNVAGAAPPAHPSSNASNSRPSSTTPSGPSIHPPPSGGHPLSRQATDTTKLANSFIEPEAAATADDFWGDMDDNADDGFGNGNDAGWGDEPQEGSDDFFSTQTSNRSSLSTNPTKTSTSSAPPMYDDKGEPDFAGWLKAQQQSGKPKKGPLPKGLVASKSSAPPARPAAKPAPATAALRTSSAAPKSTAPPSTAAKAPPEQEEQEEDDWGDAWT